MIKAFEIFPLFDLLLFIFFFIILQLFQYIERNNGSAWEFLSKHSTFTRLAFYIFLIFSVLVLGVTGDGFVYGGF